MIRSPALAALWGAVLVTGCATRPKPTPSPILTPIEVVVPVATGCVPPNITPAPVYPDTDDALKSAIDAAERYLLLYAGRKLRDARLGELEPIVSGCPKAATK